MIKQKTMKAELVFIPSPGVGHLVSTVEFAKLLVEHDDRLSITLIIVPPRLELPSPYIQSLSASSNHHLRYVVLRRLDTNTERDFVSSKAIDYIESQKPQVREAVAELAEKATQSNPPGQLAGFVIDMFCVAMIDVAKEFGVPTYMFYTSNAAFLGLEFHVQYLYDEKNFDVAELKDSDTELDVPSLTHPLPVKCLPSVMLSKEWTKFVVDRARRFREIKGITVNTFDELEPHAMKSLSDGQNPPVYPVGPVLNLKPNGDDSKRSEIMRWLDGKPPKSVVFLCFGSTVGFEEEQAREIALALERTGCRFLWSLRRSPPRGRMSPPGDFPDLREVLPEGFMERTAETGKIIGWAPQVAVLAHPSVGGFVSHCGWNSTLESIWFGVPIATWPHSAEQQFNAFEMVAELGLSAEIRMDHRNDFSTEKVELVGADEIERGIRCVMEPDNALRERVTSASEKSHVALMDGGSSYAALGNFLQLVMDNTPL